MKRTQEMKKFKEHSNFVGSLINFKNGSTRGTGTRERVAINNEAKHVFKITTRVIENYENTQVIKMIENEEKLNERLDLLEKHLNELSKERDALKVEVDAFRLIGHTNNPILENEVPEIWLAEHKQSISSMSVETRLKNLRAYQKVTEIYIESVKLDQNKIQIKSDIVDRRVADQNKTAQEIKDSKEELKKKRFGSIYKSITGFMKTGVTEAVAVKVLIDMKVQIPDGYFELCGESFKKELKALLEKK